MSLLVRLAALAGIAWLATRKSTKLAPGVHVRVVNYSTVWDDTTGTILRASGPDGWVLDLDEEHRSADHPKDLPCTAGFKAENLEVIQ